MSDLTVSVRVGIPGSLTIELDQSARFRAVTPASIYPPMSEEPITSGEAERRLLGRAWGQGWAVPVSRRLNALGGNTIQQIVAFEAPSWDQTDNLWGGTGTIDLGTDNPTFTATLFGTSIYDRTFQNGDYILWDDPTVNGLTYSYEISRILSVSGTTFTLEQRGAFGSTRAAHAAVNFYQLLDHTLFDYWDGTKQLYKFLWDDMIVAAVSATTWGATGASIVNLAAVPPDAAVGGLSTV